MKLSLLQENLNRGLNVCSRFVASKPQLPILANILLKTDKGRLKLSATNLEMGVNLWLGAKIEEEEEITVSAKTFSEFVSSLPADKIDLEFAEGNLLVSSSNCRASFPTIGPADFPKIPSLPAKADFSLPLAAFATAVSGVAFAAAADEGRPVLTGVLFKGESGGFSLVATDGYRLSVKKMAEIKYQQENSLIVPAKALVEICRLAGEKKDEGVLAAGLVKEENQLIFGLPDLELSCRLIEGEFPDYEKIIPTSVVTKIIFDREELTRAVRTASIFARESANIVKLKTENQKLKIAANAPQVGENESEIEIKQEGEDQEIAFNFRFLLDFLNSLTAAEISLEMTGPLNPGVFKPVGDDSLLHLIMPVRVQS
jgi:DNA polymerase-3 subunit beta